MKYLALAAVLVVGTAAAQVTSTRISAYDWQCTDAAGAKISDHQRFDTAFIACLNAPNGVYVQGGRYRITKTVTPPVTPPAGNSATLSWVPPTQNTDGSAAVIAGYTIHYGTSPDALTGAVSVTATSYEFTNLSVGTHYFAVRAVASYGVSDLSNMASKVIP